MIHSSNYFVMKMFMIGRTFLYTGQALIAAAALRSVLNLLKADPFDPWAVVLAVGCILASIGLGLTKSRVRKKIEKATL
jgi:hypothetical protein